MNSKGCHPERSRGIPWNYYWRLPRGFSTPLRCARNDRLKQTLTIIFIAVVTMASSALAQPHAEFPKANQEYAHGHFKEAIAGYETLVSAHQWNANLFYDLGNAYFRTGDFGRAILNYERALALDAHHPEATANLQIARDEARALELPQSWRDRYLQFASVNQYSIAAAIAAWLALFCVVVLIFAPRKSAMLM